LASYGPYVRDFSLTQDNFSEAIDELKDEKIDAIVFDFNVIKAEASED
jgi:hypothetical protein